MQAICKNCSTIFKVPPLIMAAQPGLQISFKNNTYQCPRCKEPADIIDGDYVLNTDGYLELLKTVSRSKLLALEKLAKSSKNFEEFNEGINTIDTKLARKLDKLISASKDENFRYWINMLLKLLAIVLGGAAIEGSNLNISLNNVGNTTATTQNLTYSQNFSRELRLRNLKKINDKKDDTKTKAKQKTKPKSRKNNPTKRADK